MTARLPPTLLSERLCLRAFEPKDLEPSHQHWCDPRVYQGVTGQPCTRQESWQRLLRGAGSWQLRGYGYWALCERESGIYLGEVGIADYARELDPPTPMNPEAGWVLGPHAHGKGYATEAMRTVLAWFDQEVGQAQTHCMINVGNEASGRVATKLGYKEHTQVRFGELLLTAWTRPKGG